MGSLAKRPYHMKHMPETVDLASSNTGDSKSFFLAAVSLEKVHWLSFGLVTSWHLLQTGFESLKWWFVHHTQSYIIHALYSINTTKTVQKVANSVSYIIYPFQFQCGLSLGTSYAHSHGPFQVLRLSLRVLFLPRVQIRQVIWLLMKSEANMWIMPMTWWHAHHMLLYRLYMLLVQLLFSIGSHDSWHWKQISWYLMAPPLAAMAYRSQAKAHQVVLHHLVATQLDRLDPFLASTKWTT